MPYVFMPAEDLGRDDLRFYLVNGHEASREMVAVVLATKLA